MLERDGASYRVLAGGAELRAVLRGKAKRDMPKVVAGDRVHLEPEPQGGLWAITGVETRTNVLERREPHGRGARPVVANVDRVFVVAAAKDPDPVPSIIDRMLVLAEANDMPVALVVNKTDLDPGTDLVARYRHAGYEVLPVSVRTGAGLGGHRGVAAGARHRGGGPERRGQVEPAQRARSRASCFAPATCPSAPAAASRPR